MNATEPLDRLRDLEVLAVDCQATTGRPETGFLLELAWVSSCAADLVSDNRIESAAEASLCRPPRGAEIPPRIQKITGIEPKELEKAPTAHEIWERFLCSAESTAKRNNLRRCPTVIHFRSYEEPFLRRLHDDVGGEEGTFPLDILCTHHIMRLLYPGLPRKGLRAVAGFFGYALPTLRRSRRHATATALIWRHLVRILEEEYGLTGLPELQDWLSQPPGHPKSGAGKRVYPMDRKLREDLPDQPGLYRMYRLNGGILYVGKAGSLKRRVNSYFQPQGRHAEHILEMLSQAKDLTFTPTGTALEAALRETDEIKRLAPPFNRALQENGRAISFASHDLRSFRVGSPDRTHPVGPLASPSHVSALGALAALLDPQETRISARIMEQVLSLPREHLPDRVTFHLGLQVFQEAYGNLLFRSEGLSRLLALGARLWREKLEEEARRSESTTGDPPEPTTDDREAEEEEREPGTWTPERVAGTLRSITRAATRQIRRARWLLRLYESCLIWEDKHEPGSSHVVVLEGGRARFSGPLPATKEAPIPPGHGRPLQERQAGFDISAYDRLRVLTTELRRLCAEGRVVELRLHPKIHLSQAQLKKMLPWV